MARLVFRSEDSTIGASHGDVVWRMSPKRAMAIAAALYDQILDGYPGWQDEVDALSRAQIVAFEQQAVEHEQVSIREVSEAILRNVKRRRRP